MELEGNSNAGTSAAFLRQLRKRHLGTLNVVWDNAPAHRGEAIREYLRMPGLDLRLVNLPGYSLDFNADEAVCGSVREEATGNLCLGTKALVQERVSDFLDRLASRSRKSNCAAGLSCSLRPKGSCGTHLPIPHTTQMYIPPWL